MASPQAEDGHVRIANEMWDALCLIRISGEARQVLDFIIRKTWGWGKKTDFIPLSQFCKGTGLRKSAIIKARKKLLDMNLITVTQKVNAVALSYGIQKDYTKWKPLPKKKTTTKKVNLRDQKRKSPQPKKRPSIDTGSKDTSSKTKNLVLFEKFIKLYPLKENEKEAEKAWNQLFTPGYGGKRTVTKYIRSLTDEFFKKIIDALKNQIAAKKGKKAANQFVSNWPHPSTWLRKFRWNDQIETPETETDRIERELRENPMKEENLAKLELIDIEHERGVYLDCLKSDLSNDYIKQETYDKFLKSLEEVNSVNELEEWKKLYQGG